MYEVYVNGISFGTANRTECSDYADFLVNKVGRYSSGSVCVVDCSTGEIVEEL